MRRTSNLMHITPLRYPGGKAKLAPFVKALLRENRLLDGHYVEPYAGGAGIALDLLLTEHVSNIHLNDLNYPLFCFWKSVLDERNKFIEKLNRCQISVHAWKRHRSILENAKNNEPIDVGFAFFFLNRVNRSGIINGGIIGGYHQSGSWRIDARFNKETLKKRINKIHLYKERIHLYNKDACRFLADYTRKPPEKSFIYLDPPYYEKGQRLYDNFYVHEDHRKVRDSALNVSDVPWMVSYDNCPEIAELYSRLPGYTYDLNYSAAKYYRGSELMFFNPKVRIPSDHPLKENWVKIAS